MKSKKEATIYDIAQLLHISTSTVSRALQDHPAINKNTKKKIINTAKDLGYRYNTFAGSLRKQYTKTLGIIVHELSSNFITSVLSGIEKVTAEAGYDLIITHSSESFTKEAANALNLFHKRVDGLIASLSFDTNNLNHFQPFIDKGIPVAFFDRVEENNIISTAVIIDNYKAGYDATKHLIEQGCKRIAHITANMSRNVYAQRYKGYKDALRDNNLPFEKELLLITKDLKEKSAVEATKQILKLKKIPDGIFITNDFMAAIVIKTLKEHGIHIPKDIAVVGFNNDTISTIVEPQLTTINYPGNQIGEIAARAVINHLKGVHNINDTNKIIVKSELIIRNSSLKNNHK